MEDSKREHESTIINEVSAHPGIKLLFFPWLEGRKIELTEEAQKLISEDAPKNKFSILTGKMRMIDEIFEQWETWKKP